MQDVSALRNPQYKEEAAIWRGITVLYHYIIITVYYVNENAGERQFEPLLLVLLGFPYVYIPNKSLHKYLFHNNVSQKQCSDNNT